LPSTPESLGGWILDPQKLKPGCQMPANNLSTLSVGDLQAVVAYLESLQ
jgi:cytochrome c oxidase subunit 2